MSFERALRKVEQRESLSADESRTAFDEIFTGKIADAPMAEFLLALVRKGETMDELMGAVTSLRSHAIGVQGPPGAMDIVGTGGDIHGTLNISTAAAFVVAACGVPVAKHGNKAASSRSGSSDVLKELGVQIDPDLGVVERCLEEANIAFLFAPRHHPAMKHVAGVRRQLGVRTIFNLLGPLTNPANVQLHLIGVYELDWLGPMADVLRALGSEAAWIVHGQDELDEISISAPTDVVELRHGGVRHMEIMPELAGLHRYRLDDIKGRDAIYNAAELTRLLNGAKGAYRDIVLLNAAAALVVAGKTHDLHIGVQLAEEAIDSGKAMRTLETLVRITGGE